MEGDYVTTEPMMAHVSIEVAEEGESGKAESFEASKDGHLRIYIDKMVFSRPNILLTNHLKPIDVTAHLEGCPSKRSIYIREYFMEFLSVEDTSGQGLFNELQDVLKSLDLDIDNVRGQGYDNGSNMKKNTKINMVSTKLQSENMRLDVAVKALEALVTFFENYKETGFASAMCDAKEIALDSEIDLVFQIKRHRPRKRHHDEVDVDIALSQLKNKFEQLKTFESIFGFLFDALKLISLDDQQLKENCMNLEAHLKHRNTMDVYGADLCSELQVLHMMLSEEAFFSNNPWTSMEIANFVKETDMCPNVLIAYRVLLTVPVTVASAERTFSKLKLLKSYLRTTMTQDRLNGLAILCIEKNEIEDLEYDDIINDFASKSARRQFLKG
nr:uncharacterized protein LOC114825112 [Malus domestica]